MKSKHFFGNGIVLESWLEQNSLGRGQSDLQEEILQNPKFFVFSLYPDKKNYNKTDY